MSSQLRVSIIGVAAAVASACSDNIPTAPALASSSRMSLAAEGATLGWLSDYLANPRSPAAGEPAVLAGAGDIARCYPGPNFRAYQPPTADHPAQRTSRLLDAMPGATVMALGDNAYEFGSPLDYLACYHPTWGRHRWRTRPATGNHEYLTPGALGYYLYFGRRAAPPTGYYSYDAGSWHVAVMNSTPQVYLCWPPENDELPGFPAIEPPAIPGTTAGRACAGDVSQQLWLAADLAAHRAGCTVVYFHHPRFSSGQHGNHFQMTKIWDIMYANGVDLVVVGHDHLYERFRPQTPDGVPDDATGIRQLTVGTGGADFYGVNTLQPNSERIILDTHGVVALALDEGRYAWAFVATDGSVRDSGETACH